MRVPIQGPRSARCPAAAPRPLRAPATAPPASSSLSITYRVQPGDTLRSIAASFYGDEALWERIYRANRGRLDPDNLRIGMQIDIPPLDAR